MLRNILNETDVDVLQELINENRSARSEFLSDASMQAPLCIYPHLNPERYRKSLEQIETCTASGELEKLPFFERQLQTVEKVQRKLGFFAFMWYNIGEGS